MGGSSKGQKETTEKRIVKRLPHYGKFDYARLGYFSLTTKDTKFISEEDAITIDGLTETPGYFFGQFMKGLWCAKQKIPSDNLSYPYKAIPGKCPNAVYIDIRHAFRQIAIAFGMEVFIEEGLSVAYGESLPNTPAFNNKIVRGLLVTGVDKTGSYQEWINRDIRTVKFSNPNYAPHLSYCIWSVLHAVQSVLSPFTIYGHTDGFIVPRRHVERVTTTLSEYGFNYTVKGTGFTEVYGVGNYRVGHTRTRTNFRTDKPRIYVRDDNSKWWLNAFAKGVSLRAKLNYDDLYDGISTSECD